MSYTPQEQKEHRAIMALELLAFKAKAAMERANSSEYEYEANVKLKDLNECFIVAGMPLIVPEATKEKELDVIKVESKFDALDEI